MSHTHEGPWDDRLEAYHDGELSSRDAAQVLDHLAGCAACRNRLEQMAQISRSIRALRLEPMPGSLKTAILARAGAASRAPRSMPWGLTTFAAAAVAVIAAVTVWRSGSPVPIPARQLDEVERERAATGAIPSEAAPAGSDSANAAPPAGSLGEVRSDSPVKEPARAASKDKAAPSRQKRDASGNYALRQESRALANPVERDHEGRRAAAQPEAGASPLALVPMEPPAATPHSTNVIARYTTTLVFENDRPARLTPIIAQSDDQKAAASGAALEKKQDESAPTAKSLSAQSTLSAIRPSPITFLVQADAEGRIQSATPIGARTQDATVVESARALLVGSRLMPFEAGRAMTVVVEMNLPAF